MTDTAARASRVKKITALLAKTVAAGCTPEEAAEARRLAEALMAKYDIAEAECVAPTRARAASTPSDSGADFFKEWLRAERVAAAREQYHRNGVHIDDRSFDEGCRCASCQFMRMDFTVFRPGAGAPPRARRASTAGRARSNGSHAGCAHEATKAARARCRKERGW